MRILSTVILYICIFCGIHTLYSQDMADYISKAENADNLETKMVAIDSVLSNSFRKNDSLFIAYSLKFIELAKTDNQFDAAAKKAINLQGILSKNQLSIKAVSTIDEILASKYKIKDSFLLGNLYYRRGLANLTSNLDESIEDYTNALDNYAQNDTFNRAIAHLFRGRSQVDAGNYVEGVEDFNTAYIYFEELKNYEYMLYVQAGSIDMYSRNGFYEEAEKEREKYINKAKELEIYDVLPYAYFNQSLDYAKMGKDSLTLANLKLSEKYVKHADSTRMFHVNIDAKFCEYYCKTNNLSKAEFHFNKMQEAKPNLATNLTLAKDYYGAQAIYYQAIGMFEEALNSAHKKEQIAERLGHEEAIMDSNFLLAQIYESLGKYKFALEAKNKYLEVKDKIFNKASTNSLAYYQSKYESEKRERELIVQNANIEILENQNSAFKKQAVFIGIASLLFFAMILLYRDRLSHKENKILQERFSQDLLVSQENERIRISKDLHDGLGQRLLVIKNKLLSNGDSESSKMVNDSIEEVRAISRDLYPFQLQELGITKAIEHTISEIDENTSIFISAEIENIDNLFNKEQEVNIYRIVQEALSNTVKHANAEATKVTVKNQNNNVLISVRDNGIGFEFQDRLQDKKALGLKTLLERTKFLKGQMKVQSRKKNGTLIEFQFPVI